MPVFNLGDCVRIGEGADPSLVGMDLEFKRGANLSFILADSFSDERAP